MGNDVVDLKEPGNVGKSGNLRFLKKILTAAEMEWVRKAEKPDAALWRLWAAKETAYKVLRKISAKAAFLPRQWPVVWTGRLDGKVVAHDGKAIFVSCFSNEDYIHCVGSDDASVLEKCIKGVAFISGHRRLDPSRYGRQCLKKSIAERCSCTSRQIAVRRGKKNGELQPPHLYIADRKSPIDISLSHDGRWIAYAFVV
ncbi:MAG TPA: 4'-phosphopantetheinyl transferase superfamily protein [Smithella sp.]|nr:4'-phosphopantetheinyl transferase superfamily protein [Smithella sp.]